MTESVVDFDCNLCERTYKCKQSFEFHIQVFHKPHHTDKFCTLCSKMFESKSGLRAHMSTVHAIRHAKKTSVNSTDLTCPKCGANFLWRQSHRKHLARCGNPNFGRRSCHKRDLNNNLISSPLFEDSQNFTKNENQGSSLKKIKYEDLTPNRELDKHARMLDELSAISPKVRQQLDKWLSLETSTEIPSPIRKRNTRVNNVILDCLIRAVEAADQASNDLKPNPSLLLKLD
ncbi:Sal-like protein 1 [Cichlidogyrus casuarinus]|uniref:Sal-like protein 1 n=1 Tax=Cichlidogyrus casuarinus TaxID=1844966 RepID=A0ABD2QIV6_9PLAT